MKRIHLIFLSLFSGLLLGISWPETGSITFLIFFAFVPLLWSVHHIISHPSNYNRSLVFSCSFITFFTWNCITVWWIKNASIESGVLALISNTLFMVGAFCIYTSSIKRISHPYALVLFIPFWISFEYLHLHWDLTFPWLNLGNVFAKNVWLIQWYEYTGTFGGTAWVLLANVLFFQLLKQIVALSEKRRILLKSVQIIGVLLIPILISVGVNRSLTAEKKNTITAVIVQPNIDPYNEKFNGNYMSHLQKMFSLAAEKVDSSTDYLVLPETALQENLWENNLGESESVKFIQQFIHQYPKLKVVIGANSGRMYKINETPSSTAHQNERDKMYYDDYNTALQIDSSEKIQVYHKSKLVPGVEMMPFPWLLKPLGDVAVKLGGANSSYGVQENRSVFVSSNNFVKVAPVICYESVYGEYLNNYILNGANVIFIITNDGWWGDTPGSRQHLDYARLRAIETRKSIVRSANTGISCFINEQGNVSQSTTWWQPAVIKESVTLNDEFTFYVKHGDYIAKLAVFIVALTILYAFFVNLYLTKRTNNPLKNIKP